MEARLSGGHVAAENEFGINSESAAPGPGLTRSRKETHG